MVLSSNELDRMADDLYLDRRIQTSIYCGRCGYNLKTLPYSYTCPECGSDYNARPMSMKGILVPDGSESPAGTVATVVIAWMVGGVMILAGALYAMGSRGIFVVIELVLGVSLVVLGLYCVHRGERRLRRFLRHRALWKHIAEQERSE